MWIGHFQKIRPPFETSQEKTIEWLSEAHARSENKAAFKEEISEKFASVGCKAEHIHKRGHILPDYLHTEWEKMEIFRLHESPYGKGMGARTQIYDAYVDEIFDRFYAKVAIPPDDLIHVSCTGYVSPNGAQKLVSKKNWGEETTITNAYHMGCYASIPSLRIAKGFLGENKAKRRVDIVHTEACSLHTNPSNHKLDQLVSQSLFADGFIKYSMQDGDGGPGLKILSLKEELIPNSSRFMSWAVVDFGFEMYLGKEIPVLIRRHLPGYLKRLGVNDFSTPLFAVHPGGPKILKYIQELLKLDDSQISFSYEILKQYGNMSSATLPHIWEKIVEDPEVKPSTKVISLAFGPGLTIAGSIMEKKCGS